MKIVAVSNFDDEMVGDQLEAENVNRVAGEVMTRAMNDEFSGPNARMYYRLVDDDYALHEFIP